jgi:hypothetical protein
VKFAALTFGALVVAGGLILGTTWGRIERTAGADLAATLGVERDNVMVRAVSDGMVGTALGRVERVTIAAHDFRVNGMPFFVEPSVSASGKLRNLSIHLNDFILRDLPIKSLSADIPDNRFSLGLLRQGKVRLAKSGAGTGSVTISEAGLKSYLLARFNVLESVDVKLDKYKVIASGRASFGPLLRREFLIYADLIIIDKRRLAISNTIVFLDNHRIRNGSEQPLIDALNPVLDIDRDLGLAGAFDMKELVIKGGEVTIFGAARIPNRPRQLISR